MISPKKALLGLATLAAALLTQTGSAQALIAGPDAFGLDFRFNNPGARANAMGGAFIGLADDATAAYTNPAGLTILTKPEFSVEYKYGDYTTRIMDTNGTTDYNEPADGISFVSFAYPAKNTTVTIFRHQLLNSESNFVWHETDNFDGTSHDTISVKLNAATLGIGVGTKLGERLSVGMAVGFAQADYYAEDLKYNDTAGENRDKRVVESNDQAEHYTLSLLWNVFGELNLGAVYRMGPEFDVSRRDYRYPKDDPTSTNNENAFLEQINGDSRSVIKVPDAYGLGLSYRFAPNFTMACDANFIEYSDLVEEFLEYDRTTGVLVQMNQLKLDDEWEFHLGVEYVIDLAATPLALRAGYYYRPDHRVYFNGDVSQWPTGRYIQKGDDDHIGSLGVGFLLNPNLQVDLAGSYGDMATEGFLSLVYRFE